MSSGKGNNSSRLCLSAAFRRDLPPRFAKRLQAELLEREAAEARQVGLDRTKVSFGSVPYLCIHSLIHSVSIECC